MAVLKEKIEAFLSSGSGYGFGDGSGDGFGFGSGDGSGDGFGFGSGSGEGSGYGSDYGSGYGFGDGSGYGYGYGDDISVFDGQAVNDVDGVQTIIVAAKAGFAKGYILNSDLTLTPCYVAKSGGMFAHGDTLHTAVEALREKLFEDMPEDEEDERIQAFLDAHPDKTAKVPARDLLVWHNRLTGSCEMGRNQFARDRGIDIDKDSFSPLEFCEMCRDHYGGDVILRLEERLKQEVSDNDN